jgi:hypothetical protein
VTTQLNQIVAVEKGLKSRVNTDVTKLYQQLQKPALYGGFSKVYTPKDDEGEKLPPERQVVQANVEDDLSEIGKKLTQLMDATLTKDVANQGAEGTVRVDGQELVTAPVPFLLSLEKQLIDFRTVVSKLPVLDSADTWEYDHASSLSRTAPVRTVKTRKVPKVLVKAQATERHPAQTEVYMEDVTVGYWDTTKLSGAVTNTRRKDLLERVNELIDAVKHAVEEANRTEITQQHVGERVFDYLLEF